MSTKYHCWILSIHNCMLYVPQDNILKLKDKTCSSILNLSYITRISIFAFLFSSPWRRQTWVAKTFWWLICNKITFINPNAFVAIFNQYYACNSWMERVKCQIFVMYFSMRLKTRAEDSRCVRCGCVRTATSIFDAKSCSLYLVNTVI